MKSSCISIVIPVHNEEGNIAPLVESINKAFESLRIPNELIFVDDGSDDGTYEAICKLRSKQNNIGLIKFSRNFGHQAAILAGLRASKGDAVVTMDGDLQHPPEVICQMVDKWREGFEIVHTKRLDQHNSGNDIKSVSSAFFYTVLRFASELEIESGMADFRLISRKALAPVIQSSESSLFLRGLSHWIGYNQATITYTAKQRLSGRPSFSVKKMTQLASSGIIAFSSKPLYCILPFGLIIASISIAFGVYAFLVRIFNDATISGWASLAVLISFLFGCLFIVLGILGTYLGAIHTNIKSRPRYIISDFKTADNLPLPKETNPKVLELQDFH